jgi:hypothetical protein
MSYEKYLDLMRQYIGAGDVVYSVMRDRRRSFWKELLDTIFTNGLFTSASDVHDAVAARYFLIAGDDSATIVKIASDEVETTFDVPAWKSGMKTNFKKVDVDNFRYRKVAKIS